MRSWSVSISEFTPVRFNHSRRFTFYRTGSLSYPQIYSEIGCVFFGYYYVPGEPPFRDRQFNRDLLCDILGGLRPLMPDSAPEEYKKLAERCCDADPDKHPDAYPLYSDIYDLVDEADKDDSDDNAWNTIYHNDVKP